MNKEDSTVSQQVDDMPAQKYLINPDMRYHFDLDKKHFRIRVPMNEESEERVHVYIEPIGGK